MNLVLRRRATRYWLSEKMVFLAILFSFNLSWLYGQQSEDQNSTLKPVNQIVLTGTIVDEDGIAIPGVTVREKGTVNGTVTDADGKYSISVDPNSVLVFSFMGFKSQEVDVKESDKIDLILQVDSQDLDEVIVVGYGAESTRKVLSSVSKVPVEEIKNTSFTNIGQAISGISPGVITRQFGGGPGNDVPSISIRGGGEPLYVIDGVISNKNDFARLSPSDISDISILKDAGASAVYGSRAANGVVLVQTKKPDGNSVTYNNVFGLSSPALEHRPLSSYEYAVFNNKIAKLYGVQEPWSSEEIQKFRDGGDPNYPNTNWMDLTMNPAPLQRHNLSFSGKDNSLSYLMSLSMQNQGSGYQEQNVYARDNYSILAKIGKDFQSSGVKFDLTIRSSFQDFKNVPFSPWAIFGHATNNLPYQRAYDDQGRYLQVNGINNPVYEISGENGYDKSKTREFNGIADLVWDVNKIDGLQLGLKANYVNSFYQRKLWQALQPVYSIAGDRIEQPLPRLSQWLSNTRNYLLQSFVKYEREIGSHQFNGSLYYEEAEMSYEDVYAFRQNFVSEAIDYMFAGPQAEMDNSGRGDEAARRGFIGRFNYDYKDKYLMSFTFRYDGSERFPKENRWGFFPSLSLGWRVSDEPFFKNLVSEQVVDDLKIRISYGETGNDNIARFAFLSTFQPIQKRYYWNDEWMTGFRDNGLPARNISWYTQKSYNAGLDASLWDGKLNVTADAFYYRTEGFLANPEDIYSTPLGTGLPQINYGSDRRGGYEFSLSWRDRIGRITYNVGANISHYQTLWELNPYESEATLKNPRIRSTYEKNYSGVGYQTDGLFQSNDEILNSPRSIGAVELLPGDVKFKDINGDGIIDVNDRTRIGNGGYPDFYYGLNFGLNYRSFYISGIFQGASNYDLWLGGRFSYADGGADVLTLQTQTDVWTPDNTTARFPRINYSGKRSQNTDLNSEIFKIDMGYVRLKNLEVGYNLESSSLKWMPVKNARIFVGGANIWTYAPGTLNMHDPETGDGANYAYPIEKTWSLGMNVNF